MNVKLNKTFSRKLPMPSVKRRNNGGEASSRISFCYICDFETLFIRQALCALAIYAACGVDGKSTKCLLSYL